MSVEGDLGEDRPGTTLDARWLEMERHCTVWVERDAASAIVAVNAVREGEWSQFVRALHAGEEVEARGIGGIVRAHARVSVDGVGFDRDPGEFLLELVRVRGVPSCALDEVDRHGKMGNEAIGDAIGRHRTLVAREVRGALRKAVEVAEEMGMDAEDLIGALMGGGR